MPPQDANPTPSFGGFGLRRRISFLCELNLARAVGVHNVDLIWINWRLSAVSLNESGKPESTEGQGWTA